MFGCFVSEQLKTFTGYLITLNQQQSKCEHANKEVRGFSIDDFKKEIKGIDTIHYTPIPIIFSKVLYADDLALVYVKLCKGLGTVSDIGGFGFVFKKKDKNWIIQKVGSKSFKIYIDSKTIY